MQQPHRKILLKLLIPWLLFFVALIAIGYLLNTAFFLKDQLSKQIEQNPQAIVDAVSKLIILPTNETPTVATITDLSKLDGQLFFADAKLGDKVLIYTQAQKAILYDPAANKIVEIAPLNIGANNSNATSSKK